MNNYGRWAAIIGALLLAAIVGGIAYNAGVTHGIEQGGKIVVAPGAPGPYPYPYYGWHPWGFGSFFGPLFFIFFLFFVIRGLFCLGAWHHRGACGPGGPGGRLEEWHRQMHERMKPTE